MTKFHQEQFSLQNWIKLNLISIKKLYTAAKTQISIKKPKPIQILQTSNSDKTLQDPMCAHLHEVTEFLLGYSNGGLQSKIWTVRGLFEDHHSHVQLKNLKCEISAYLLLSLQSQVNVFPFPSSRGSCFFYFLKFN